MITQSLTASTPANARGLCIRECALCMSVLGCNDTVTFLYITVTSLPTNQISDAVPHPLIAVLQLKNMAELIKQNPAIWDVQFHHCYSAMNKRCQRATAVSVVLFKHFLVFCDVSRFPLVLYDRTHHNQLSKPCNNSYLTYIIVCHCFISSYTNCTSTPNDR